MNSSHCRSYVLYKDLKLCSNSTDKIFVRSVLEIGIWNMKYCPWMRSRLFAIFRYELSSISSTSIVEKIIHILLKSSILQLGLLFLLIYLQNSELSTTKIEKGACGDHAWRLWMWLRVGAPLSQRSSKIWFYKTTIWRCQ